MRLMMTILTKTGDGVTKLTEHEKQTRPLPGETAPSQLGKLQYIAEQVGNRYDLKGVAVDFSD
jgi:hypothetical protein